MSNSDFKEQAEKYKQEMMKLYNVKPHEKLIPPAEYEEKDSGKEELKETEIPVTPEEENNAEANEAATEETAEEANETAEKPISEDIEKRFPVPKIPDFIRENKVPDSSGYLKVSVKTGNGGLPVENSLVTISEMKDGREHIIRILTTDSSGNTETIKLPAPINTEGSTPESYENFSKYNISVFSEGYFRETSVDAPVFAGVTSLQTFNLIPEPFDYNSGEKTIVYRNTEPIF